MKIPRLVPARLVRVRGRFAALLLVGLLLALRPAWGRSVEDLSLKSAAVLVVDQDTGEALIAKNAEMVMPIASLTKLMTALVVVDARLPMDEMLQISSDDVDREKHSGSRLAVGTRLSRSTLLLLALMSSENRAAMALSRGYPGGRAAFIARMNAKARALGMLSTHFADPAGLSSQTTSTARDLLRLVAAADGQAVIRADTTHMQEVVRIRSQPMMFVNTNRMVRNNRDWTIELQKTGFTDDAGRCMVMRASTLNHRLSMVFLNSVGTLTRFADASRVRKQLALLETRRQPQLTAARIATKSSSQAAVAR